MEVAPFFVDFHHFLSIFTIFYRFSRFTHFCRDLRTFSAIFFGQNSLLRNITRFLHVCPQVKLQTVLTIVTLLFQSEGWERERGVRGTNLLFTHLTREEVQSQQVTNAGSQKVDFQV